MRVSEYLFRSPYPSQVQVGTPDIATAQSNENSKSTLELTNEQKNSTIKNEQVKSTAPEGKLTASTDSLLDIYA